MWRSLGTLVLLGIAATLLVSGPTPGGAAAPSPAWNPQQRSQVGGQVETFRRLIYLTLRESLEPGQSGDKAANFWRSALGQVAATYLPGYGLCVSVELRTAARAGADASHGGHPDLWTVLTKDVEADRSPGERFFQRLASHCNECGARNFVSLATAADAVVRTVAQHGHQLSTFESDDRLTVAFRLTPRADSLSHMMHSMDGMRNTRTTQRPRSASESPREAAPPVAASAPAEPADLSAVPADVKNLSAAVKDGTAPTNILLTFRMHDLLLYHQKKLSLDDLAKAAEVVHY